jgi:hypothetical protein
MSEQLRKSMNCREDIITADLMLRHNHSYICIDSLTVLQYSYVVVIILHNRPCAYLLEIWHARGNSCLALRSHRRSFILVLVIPCDHRHSPFAEPAEERHEIGLRTAGARPTVMCSPASRVKGLCTFMQTCRILPCSQIGVQIMFH